MQDLINKRIGKELNIPLEKVVEAAALLDEGNTVPFIARYRKEMTGGLSDEDLRLLSEKLALYRNLEKKRQDVLRLIEAQEALTPELKAKIEAAAMSAELDDLYRPYRPKKRTRATMARERGLAPLALSVLEGHIDPAAEAENYIDPEKDLPDVSAVLHGVSDIIAEMISDDAGIRKTLRHLYLHHGTVKTEKKGDAGVNTYDHYANFSEPLIKMKPHQILAVNRALNEKVMDLKVLIDEKVALSAIRKPFVTESLGESCRELIVSAGTDSYRRLIHPSLEREIWQVRLEEAMAGAVGVFKQNLKKRLLVPPVRLRRVMGLDPGFRTGCKLACVSETGELLEVATIYPTPPKNDLQQASAIVLHLLNTHRIDCIAIGNGTASRESEEFIAALINKHNPAIEYTIVNEAGASVYSASTLAQKEFPRLDVAERSAISIARRLQDPLAELVKIDPKSIGVGQYQHDLPPRRLDEALTGTVEGCVNQVGVDLNTASASLLAYVAGINKAVVERIIEHRNLNSTISSREQLLKVSGLGPKVFKQCAGFLRISESPDYLERSAVHPESYDLARRLMERLEISPQSLGRPGAIPSLTPEEVEKIAQELNAGAPTVADILEEFRKPGRDPREDLPKPVFLKSVTNIDDLRPGMVLMGIVRNIIDFGAFVDIGVHQDGLVHISEITNRYIRHPLDVLQIEETVQVKILSIDRERSRIALSIKQAT